MEKQISTADKIYALVGCASSLLGLIAAALSLLGKLPPVLQESFAWWGFLGVLLLIGLWLLWSALLAPKSRLLQPERFVIRPEERRHLKGREEELSELADLCEQHPLVFLEGESGAGKTALVRSGLVEECRRRRRLHPVYLDLSGADWENRLFSLLWGELRLSLSDSNGKIPPLPLPSSLEELFPFLAHAAAQLDRRPLLIFDQFDDYQSIYRQRFREGDQKSTWISHEILTKINHFWMEVARLVNNGAIHCLFVSRTDNAAGFDAVRFVEARTYRLSRVSRSLIAPLLDEITIPETESRPVVAHPEKGWETLKERLLADLTEDDAILPVQLSVVLQALRRFPVLSIREYERHGGAVGLERFYIEQNLLEAAQVTGLTVEQLRQILVSLVDPVKQKTVQLTTAGIEAVLASEGASDRKFPSANQVEKSPGIPGKQEHRPESPVRGRGRRPLAAPARFSLPGGACRRTARQSLARRFAGGGDPLGGGDGHMAELACLLSPREQVRLASGWIAGKFRYGRQYRFALLSTLRFLPYAVLLLGIWGAAVEYQRLV